MLEPKPVQQFFNFGVRAGMRSAVFGKLGQCIIEVFLAPAFDALALETLLFLVSLGAVGLTDLPLQLLCRAVC